MKITFYNVFDREVATLVDEEKKPGVYEVKLDGKNLASGVYFYTIRTGDFIQSKKMILMK
ncbi:MAG: T9SS type A sorting domain-containing protein [Stygiobacter sp.]